MSRRSMSRVSETAQARRDRNRRNAMWSTGPRSEKGKAASRANSMRWGLAGDGRVVHPEDHARFSRVHRELVEEFGPVTPMENTLVEQVALAKLRLRRAQELIILASAPFDYTPDDDDRAVARQVLFDEGVALFKDDPAAALERLQRVAPGLEWLLRRWEDLRAELERTGRLSFRAFLSIIGLMGETLESYDPLDERYRPLDAAWVALGGRSCRRYWEAVWKIDGKAWEEEVFESQIHAATPDPERAVAFVAALIDLQTVGLRGYLEEARGAEGSPTEFTRADFDWLLDREFGPDYDEEATLEKLRRHERDNERKLYRGLAELRKLRSAAGGVEDPAERRSECVREICRASLSPEQMARWAAEGHPLPVPRFVLEGSARPEGFPACEEAGQNGAAYPVFQNITDAEGMSCVLKTVLIRPRGRRPEARVTRRRPSEASAHPNPENVSAAAAPPTPHSDR